MRSLPLIGAIDQFLDSTDVLSYPRVFRETPDALREMGRWVAPEDHYRVVLQKDSMEDIRLSGGEIAELDESVRRSGERSSDLRAGLIGTPAVPGTGGFVAKTLAGHPGGGPREDELVPAAKSGDPRAREELAERFLPLIVSVARPFRVEDLEFGDLIQEGCVGLLRALARFDPDRGTP